MLFVQRRPVGRPPVCPAAQAANFGLLDLQLTEADRRPSCAQQVINGTEGRL